ncbi:unnamed protein product [Arabis nemorensis]|uniref:Uncharacterized protein n=1 Tax=Arabis nemorensis TaxID=586526 RepID=A0A565B856_9BRAS|nr:unnamed protein product [Arabis nemorensis]
MENNNNQFWQFSDQLRVQNLANLSLNDSIWSTNSVYKRNDDRTNLDIAKNPIDLVLVLLSTRTRTSIWVASGLLDQNQPSI